MYFWSLGDSQCCKLSAALATAISPESCSTSKSTRRSTVRLNTYTDRGLGSLQEVDLNLRLGKLVDDGHGGMPSSMLCIQYLYTDLESCIMRIRYSVIQFHVQISVILYCIFPAPEAGK